jgi:pimeloyl-[acyl-carrier protein] methyl ester esterase
MRHEWLIHEKRERLILFFAGWGMDARPFRNLGAVSSDVLVLSAYHETSDATAIAERCAEYAHRDVVAWSLGVVMAGHWCAASNIALSQVIALNGTPYPAHNEKGIPCDRFDGTLDQLSAGSLSQFYRRMCGRPEVLKPFLRSAPAREVDDLRRELSFLRDQPPCAEALFTQAIVASRDRIVPPENQRRCWREAGVPCHEIDEPHFLFNSMTHWEAVLDVGDGA